VPDKGPEEQVPIPVDKGALRKVCAVKMGGDLAEAVLRADDLESICHWRKSVCEELF
jgi:hypothetical protein